MRSPALLLLSALLPLTAFAQEAPPPLSKLEAQRILEAMEYREVTVIAVVQGVNDQKVTGPSLAFVLAMAKRDTVFSDLKVNLYHDRDLGWFTYESTPKAYRIWTKNGYREFRAGVGW